MVVAVDIGGTKIRTGINSDGVIISQRRSLLKAKDSSTETLDQLIGMIAPLMHAGIRGIGIGVPSVVDTKRGIIYNAVNIPSWKKVELKDILEKEFEVPVHINNDVNCFILGEHHFGLARDFRSVVGLTLGTGLGAGIIINGQLYEGNNCGAGEIGYLPYKGKNLEQYCSSLFFESVYHTTALKIFHEASTGNPEALRLWQEYGFNLGNAIKSIIYAYDPEAIIIGGSIAKAYDFFAEAMRNAMQDFLFPESLRRLRILQSRNEDIQLLGAAALVK